MIKELHQLPYGKARAVAYEQYNKLPMPNLRYGLSIRMHYDIALDKLEYKNQHQFQHKGFRIHSKNH